MASSSPPAPDARSLESSRLVRDLIYDHCGIYFEDDSLYLLHRRLASRLSALSLQVFGNDISRRVLSMARKAQYGRASFRTTDPRLQRRYFREVDGKHQVRDEVRQLVRFGQINLLDESMVSLVSDVDVIFCRNVLIY